MTKTRIITHSAGFHADDVFGVATLLELLGEENVEIIRSRDPEVIATGDYVLDVGGIDDPARNRFDHHQEGGAGERANGLPYAAFGLIWKKFGAELCESQEVADEIDARLVTPLDAHDNGVSVWDPKFENVAPYGIANFIGSLAPVFGEDLETLDTSFLRAVEFARVALRREIAAARANQKITSIVKDAYDSAPDKQLIVIDVPAIDRAAIGKILVNYPEPLYYVFENKESHWQIACVWTKDKMFGKRKALPESWAGKRDAEFAEITGVSDVIFCHNARFMAVAKSKEGALKLAELALAANN